MKGSLGKISRGASRSRSSLPASHPSLSKGKQLSYRILFTRRAERDLNALPASDQVRIGRRIDALASNPRPRGAKKLSGSEDFYRVRSGVYRVVYRIEDRVITVTVIRIGHRRDIYR